MSKATIKKKIAKIEGREEAKRQYFVLHYKAKDGSYHVCGTDKVFSEEEFQAWQEELDENAELTIIEISVNPVPGVKQKAD